MTLDQVRASASKPGFGVVTMTVRATNQHAAPVLQMTVSSLVPRAPAAQRG